MKVKVKPAPKTAGKRSMRVRQKRLVKWAAYILRGICDSRDWDTACKGCPVPTILPNRTIYMGFGMSAESGGGIAGGI